MRKTIRIDDWSIRSCAADAISGQKDTLTLVRADKEPWIPIGPVMEVQEALIHTGQISDTLLEDGNAEYCQWVNDVDWVYRTEFSGPEQGGDHPVFLEFKGLDTVCDIFLNDRLLGSGNTMYLNFRFDVTEQIRDKNELIVYFHAHRKMLDQYEQSMPEAWKGHVPVRQMLRKSDDYAATFGYSPIGLFDDVLLDFLGEASVENTDLEVTFRPDRAQAYINLSASGSASAESVRIRFTVEEENGDNAQITECTVAVQSGSWSAETRLTIDDPVLWWPKNYGEQNRYRIRYEVLSDGRVTDTVTKMTGLRDVQMVGSMKFSVNGVIVRFWGANFAPVWGPTNRYNARYMDDLIRKADAGNINAMRIWGPSKPYPDDLYEACDRRGIMLWQDFPTGGAEMPDSDEYKKLYLDEAAYMIRRLKHHPSILLWCGGNENIYMSEYLNEYTSRIGFEMLTHGFKKLCMEQDPSRYYHVSCPYEGRYTNDPLFGDTHGSRAYLAFVAGETYPIFNSENIRVHPPMLKSARRFMGEEIWDDGFVDTKPFGTEQPMPSGWAKRLGNFGERKLGPINDYYSGRNPYELIYKFAAAAGQDIYAMVARSRRGNPAWRSHEERQCTGQMIWKYNDPWPHFYCSMVDYYGEPSLTYYAAKRAFAPFLIDFEVSDHIYLWGVNDTREDRSGTVEITVFNLESENGSVRQKTVLPASVPAGDSVILTNLDRFGFIRRHSVLHACFRDAEGTILATAVGTMLAENMLPFPDARLTLSFSDGILSVTTDKYARCVELSAGADGEEFGWYFSDNYFDLLPFETKEIRVNGSHESGVVCAKAHYAEQTATLSVDGITELT